MNPQLKCRYSVRTALRHVVQLLDSHQRRGAVLRVLSFESGPTFNYVPKHGRSEDPRIQNMKKNKNKNNLFWNNRKQKIYNLPNFNEIIV